jgi:hypothetical protein
LIGPHLTPANCGELLASVRYKSKREVAQFVAAFAPKPDVAASVRKLPARTQLAPRQATGASPRPRAGMGSDELRPETVRASLQRALNAEGVIPKPSAACLEEAGRSSELRTPAVASESTLPAGINGADAALPRSAADARPRPAVVAPLAPERYKVQFTASRELHDKLRRAQDLLRHTVPDGDVAVVFDRALTLLVEDLERRKLAATTRPRAHARDSRSPPSRGTSLLPSSAASGPATKGSARSSAHAAVAPSVAFWSSTTWCRSRLGERRAPGI